MSKTFARSEYIAGVLEPNQWVSECESLVESCLVHTIRAEKNCESPVEKVKLSVGCTLVGKQIALKVTPNFLQNIRTIRGEIRKTNAWQKARQILTILFEVVEAVYGNKLLTEKSQRPFSLTNSKKFELIVSSLAATFIMYLDAVTAGIWDKELKYHTNFYFCKLTKTEPPACIDSIHKPGTIFVGPLTKILKRLVLKRDDKSWLYLNSVLQGVKRGMPHLDVNRVNESAVKHAKVLAEPKSTPGWLLDEVSRTAKEIWSGHVTIEKPTVSMKMSRNACLENKKSEQGALGYLMNQRRGLSMNFSDRKAEMSCRVLDCDCEYILGSSEKILVAMRWSVRHGSWSVYTDFAIDEEVIEARRGQGRDAKWGETTSAVKFIKEPLKIRTITKGSLYSNAIYPEVQEQLWGGLQKFPQFQLTGQPMTINHVDWLCRQAEKHSFFSGIYDYCSGDYSAATDKLHMDCSLAAIDGATSDPITKMLITSNMCGQSITYDGAFGKGFVPPDDIEQKNGQLMGSLYSFPFLCCINLAVFRSAMEKEFKRKFLISELPVLVNGDDILFPTNASLQQRWESMIPLAGFEKSVGKNFVSSEFLMVNSQLFRRVGYKMLKLDQKSRRLIRNYKFVPLLNASFFSGVKKGQEFKAENDVSYNDRLNNLRGAFRDLNTQFMPKEIAERYVRKINTRLDIKDSKYSQYDLGIEDSIPYAGLELKKFVFHRKRKYIDTDVIGRDGQLNTTPVRFESDWALNRFRLPEVHENISHDWASFLKKETKFSFVEMIKLELRKKILKGMNEFDLKLMRRTSSVKFNVRHHDKESVTEARERAQKTLVGNRPSLVLSGRVCNENQPRGYEINSPSGTYCRRFMQDKLCWVPQTVKVPETRCFTNDFIEVACRKDLDLLDSFKGVESLSVYLTMRGLDQNMTLRSEEFSSV
jgi:hypothetical protein